MAVGIAAFRLTYPWLEVDDEETLGAFLRSAQEVIEAGSNRPLTSRRVELQASLPDLSVSSWWLPVAPVISVEEVSLIIPGEPDFALPVDAFRLLSGHNEPCLWFDESTAQAIGSAVQIQAAATVGYEDARAPAGLTQAIKMLVKEWFDMGVSIGNLPKSATSFGVSPLISQGRYERPREFG